MPTLLKTCQLLAKMLVETLGNLAKSDGGLGQAIVEQVLRVRLAFIDLKLRLPPATRSA